VCEHAHAQKSGSWAKEICKADAFNTCLIFLNQDYRRWAERESSVTADYKHDPILPEHYARMFACVDIKNPWLLMNYRSEEVAKAAQKMQSGSTDSTLACWGAALEAVGKAYKNELTDCELQTMRSWSNPFYADMCEDILRCTRESIANSSKDLEHVEDIAPEALFQAIIAPHKGKVILVDFWNTWCGPCRKAIKEIEPHKTGQLSSDDLVWVYIANGTSPIGTYSNMITGIKGVHYRVSDAQWDYLTSKMFDIDGIPSYVLVNRDGSYSLRNDLRRHYNMLSVLKEELEKE
jgi:thiol-disulfide isomerase/thioredoxin